MTPTDRLTRCVLQHSALIQNDHRLLAVRLAWRALPGHAEPLLAELLGAIEPGPRPGAAALLLPLRDRADLAAMRGHGAWPGLWLEYPAAWTETSEALASLLALRAGGATLLARGRFRVASPLASGPVLFIDAGGPRRVQVDIEDLSSMQAAFDAGAHATLGWPVRGAPLQVDEGAGEPALQVLTQAIRHIDRDDGIDALATLFDHSPTLAFRLLALLNSAAGGLRVAVTSVRHAIMLLGYRKLRQWIALLLVSALETPRNRPLLQAALRRAFLLQDLGMRLGAGDDAGDMFVCGIFSLLDQMLGKPMPQLLRELPLPEEVSACLARDDGPYGPYLKLARQLESNRPFDLAAACELTATTIAEVNGALLKSLAQASAIEFAAPVDP